MADTYRGLTIKIGADTTKLSDAIKAASSAASAAQAVFKKMTQALKADPSSSAALVRQVEEVGNKARDTSQRLASLRDAYDQLRTSSLRAFDGRTVEDMAGEVQNANLRVGELRDTYAAVTSEMTKTYDKVRQMTGVGLSTDRKSTNYIWSASSVEALHSLNVEFDRLKDTPDTIADKLAALGAEGGGITEEMAQHVHSLRDSFDQTAAELEGMRSIASFKDLSGEIDATSASVVDLTRKFVSLSQESDIARSGGFVTLKDQLSVLDPALENIQSQLQRVDAALDLDPTNVGLVAQKSQLLADYSSTAEQKVSVLKGQLAVYDAAGVGKAADEMGNVSEAAERAADEYRRVVTQVQEMEGQLGRARAEAEQLDRSDVSHLTKGGEDARARYEQLQATISECEGELSDLKARQEEAKEAFDTAQQCKEYQELKTAIGEAEAAVHKYDTTQDDAKRKTEDAWSNMQSIGNGLRTTVTQYVTQAGQYSIQAATDIDSAYRDMRKTVDGTDEQFRQLKSDAESFASTHVTSADQVLEIQAMGGQLGIAVDQLGMFSEVVSNLDVATNIDAGTVAQQLGQMNAVMPDINGNFQSFGDALVRLGNNAPALESDIVDISQRIGSQASLYKMSTPDVLAWATAVASTGQKSEAAGTAIANSFTKVNDYVTSGDETFYRLMATSGMTADEIKAKWGTEGGTTEVMQAFIQSLSDAASRGENVDTILSDLGISGARQKQAIEGLTQTVGGLNDYLAMSNDAWNGTSDAWGQAGDAANEAEKKAEGFSGQLQIMKNNAQVAGAELAEGFVPYIKGANTALKGMTDTFRGMGQGTKTAIVSFAGIAAAAGPVLVATSSVRKAYQDIAESTQLGTSLTKALGTEYETLGGTVTTVGATLRSFAFTLAGVVAAYAVTDQLTKVAIGYQESADAASAAAASASDWAQSQASVQGALVNTDSAFSNSGQSVTTLQRQTSEAFGTITSTIESNVSQWGTITEQGVSDIKEALGHINDNQRSTAEAFGNVMTSIQSQYTSLDASNVVQYTKDVQSAFDQGKQQLDTTLQQQLQDIQAYHQMVGDIGSESYNNDVQAAQDAYNQSLSALQGYRDQAVADTSSLYGELDQATADGWASMAAHTETYRSGMEKFFGDRPWLPSSHILEDDFNEFRSQLDYNTTGAWLAAQASTVAAGGRLSGAAAQNVANIIGAFDDLPEALQDEGTESMRALAAAVEANGTDLGDIGSMTGQQLVDALKAKFGELPASASDEVSRVQEVFAGLSTMANPDVHINYTDDGTITMLQGMTVDLNNMTINGKSFRVSDNGTIQLENGLVMDLDRMTINGKSFTVDDRGTIHSEWQQINGLDIKTIGDKSFSINVNDHATSVIDNLKAKLRSLDGMTATTYTRAVYTTIHDRESARGGIRYHAEGGYRYHADGFVATRATELTRDIVGEAGAEAIVPLTNRRYSQPFADVIADGVAARLGTPASVTSYNISGLTFNDVDLMHTTVYDFLIELQRRAAMNVG